jgi:hypothetical protein
MDTGSAQKVRRLIQPVSRHVPAGARCWFGSGTGTDALGFGAGQACTCLRPMDGMLGNSERCAAAAMNGKDYPGGWRHRQP